MSITSVAFLAFLFALLIAYYLIPRRYQWVLLLAASILFYILCGGARYFICVLFTAVTVYLAARILRKMLETQKAKLKEQKQLLSKDELKQLKNAGKKKRKAVLLLAILLNVGVLCYFKYSHFFLGQVNSVLARFGTAPIPDIFSFILPLGISFYTFQAIGYLLDVYWEFCEPETNFFRFLLFISFFPQITQGPISEYSSLSSELFSEHVFSYERFARGFWRMLWGFAKKLMIADVFAVYVSNVFSGYAAYTGLTTLLGAFCYSVQIYADFSGYMDIMCGLCEMLGIRLRENFERPYFSKSIAEYWRRWHISLGDWFKKYIYYPIGISGWSRKLAKSAKEKLGARFSDTIPATVALLIVWSATGLWHGASWAYIIWGLLNGLFIILSMWMEPVYKKVMRRLRINAEGRAFRVFQVLRTFVLVTFIKVLPEVGDLRDGLGLWKHIFTNWQIHAGVKELVAFVTTGKEWFAIALTGVAAMLAVSLVQRKRRVTDDLLKLPYPVRLLAAAVAVVIVIAFGGQALYYFGGGGFLYAGF